MFDEWLELRERLLFPTPTARFPEDCSAARESYRRAYAGATATRQQGIVRLLAELAVDLRSYLPRWRLQRPEEDCRLEDRALDEEVSKLSELLNAWGAAAEIARIRREADRIRSSNLLKLAQLADQGRMGTRWGHDYASGIVDSVRRGAVLVTTNPPLVNKARNEDPATWDPVRDAIREANRGAPVERLVSLLTMQVVLRNCRVLRPIFAATGGRCGYVNLQVNPHNATNPDAMVAEAEFLHGELARELGGKPNVVFKVPGTEESLEAVRQLAAKGIGVSITVSFSVAQHRAFADVIEQGAADVSYLVMMSGRLDDPIRDELAQAGVADAAEVARWASTAVIRRSYDLLFRQRGCAKSCLLVASLRGPWNLEAAFTDGERPILVTSFPDKTAEFDAEPRPIASRINEPVAEDVLTRLRRSRLFRQAHEVDGLAPPDFNTFPPVLKTLDEFVNAYDQLVGYVRG